MSETRATKSEIPQFCIFIKATKCLRVHQDKHDDEFDWKVLEGYLLDINCLQNIWGKYQLLDTAIEQHEKQLFTFKMNINISTYFNTINIDIR